MNVLGNVVERLLDIHSHDFTALMIKILGEVDRVREVRPIAFHDSLARGYVSRK